ncbi:MAG TPA: DUF1223 domain-containing protein [Stellaceae bacterium]|nr:DUF1223 domain-containing protein [Stellaceae bacterium]
MTRAAAFSIALLLLFAAPAAAARPVVVELYTSEGCSSCPPADALLAELATRPGVLALSFDVDYWDRLGWKDPFSSAAATARQRDYARLLGVNTVYTPQIVVDGHWQVIGSDRDKVGQAIAAARSATVAAVPVSLALDHGRARVAIAAAGTTGSIVLIGFDRRHVDAVRGGENTGRILTHVNVVRGIAEIGRFDGKATTIEAPIGWHSDRLAVLVEAADGHILGAAVADIAPL